MTNAELNRDIKRLWKKVQKFKETSYNHDYYEKLEKEVFPEWKRLWLADREIKVMKLEQYKAMIDIGRTYNLLKLHRHFPIVNL